jgi:hypothetical protein
MFNKLSFSFIQKYGQEAKSPMTFDRHNEAQIERIKKSDNIVIAQENTDDAIFASNMD